MKITYFYLASCPHCRRCNTLIDEIVSENPKYAAVEFERIEESQNPSIAERMTTGMFLASSSAMKS